MYQYLIQFLALSVALAASAQTPEGSLREVVEGGGADRPSNSADSTQSPDLGDSLEDDSDLDIRARIALLMFVTLEGRYGPDSGDRIILREFPPGGVVIPRVSSPTSATSFVEELRKLPIEKTSGIPLLIAANAYALTQHTLLPDKEFMQLPSILSVVAANDPATTRRFATLLGTHLDKMGFNLHFGPSLVLASPLAEAEGSVHYMGSDPLAAAEVSAALFPAFREAGIHAVAVGFPGGGTNRVKDEPAVLLTMRTQLHERDLMPYAAAIREGVRFVHVSDTLVPTIDKNAGPAFMSSIVINDILRGELEFDGVVIAGPVDSRGVAKRFRSHEAALRALKAGADMIYWQHGGTSVVKAILAIALAVDKGILDREVIDRAVDRVLAMKEELGLADRDEPTEKQARKLSKDKDKIHDSFLVERNSVTLIQNRGGLLPLSLKDSMPIGVTGVVGVEELHDALEEHIKPIAQQPIVTARHIDRIQSFEIDRLTRHARGMKTAICIFSQDVKPAGQREVIREFHSIGARVVAVLVGYPAHLPYLVEAEAVVLAYNAPHALSQTMIAVAEMLVGRGPLMVLEASRDLEKKSNEEIIFDAADVLRTPSGRLPVTLRSPFGVGYSTGFAPLPNVVKVEWDFGDGKTSRDFKAVHSYAHPGHYKVTLVATDKQEITVEGEFGVLVRD